MRRVLLVGLAGFFLSTSTAYAFTLDLLESGEDAAAELSAALVTPGSGIAIVGGTASFRGVLGDGTDPTTAQSATYSGFVLAPGDASLPTLALPDGIFLTNGTANIPVSNTDTAFSPFFPTIVDESVDGDADLSAILTAAGAPSSIVNEVNTFAFSFTVSNPSLNAIAAQFVFGSDEFPDQAVTDIFAFIVDGTNYAFFQDGSLVSFVEGANAANFLDNAAGAYPIEYDGLSRVLTVTGLLDPSLTTHTLKISIADTADYIFDSGVFVGRIGATTSTGQGGITIGNGNNHSLVPEATNWGLMIVGFAGIALAARRQRHPL